MAASLGYVTACNLGRIFIAVKRHYDHRKSYKEMFDCGGLLFRGLEHYHHSGEHGGVQADVVLEKDLRVLHLAGNRRD